MNERRLVIESTDQWEDEATFVFSDEQLPDEDRDIFPTNKGGLIISVSEEHAVDSYNSMFECTIHLTPEQTETLLTWMLQNFPIRRELLEEHLP